MRYAEEVELLLEEMRRVVAFLEWDRDRWKKRALHAPQWRANDTTPPQTLSSPSTSATLGTQPAFEEGLKAYALRQASVRERLLSMFLQQWHDVPAFIKLTDQGLSDDGGGREVGG
jgi:hypothetical protein